MHHILHFIPFHYFRCPLCSSSLFPDFNIDAYTCFLSLFPSFLSFFPSLRSFFRSLSLLSSITHLLRSSSFLLLSFRSQLPPSLPPSLDRSSSSLPPPALAQPLVLHTVNCPPTSGGFDSSTHAEGWAGWAGRGGGKGGERGRDGRGEGEGRGIKKGREKKQMKVKEKAKN